jgi:hypothetical protein
VRSLYCSRAVILACAAVSERGHPGLRLVTNGVCLRRIDTRISCLWKGELDMPPKHLHSAALDMPPKHLHSAAPWASPTGAYARPRLRRPAAPPDRRPCAAVTSHRASLG